MSVTEKENNPRSKKRPRKRRGTSSLFLSERFLRDFPWDPENRSDLFLSSLPEKGNILLTSHDNPDPDALASCLALQKLIRAKKGLTARIAIGGILGRAENQAMCLKLDIDLYPIDILEDKRWDAIVMVDAQPLSGNANLPAGMPVTAVIDHHPKRSKIAVPFVDIRPEYGAASSILVEFLLAQNVPLDNKLATALFYAIRTETTELGRGICDADRMAYFALLDNVDWEILHSIIQAKIPADYFKLFPKGIEVSKVYGDTLICNLGEIPAPDSVAELADFMLRHQKVSRALVLGRYEEYIVYSIRFTHSDMDAGMVASQIARGLGSGGGHDLMAGGRISLNKFRQKQPDEILTILADRFLEEVNMSEHKPGRLLLARNNEEE